MNLSPIRAGRWLALAPLLVPALAHPVPRQELLPPASPAATPVSRMASRSDVLPWSTWPMTVTTGGRGLRSSSLSW